MWSTTTPKIENNIVQLKTLLVSYCLLPLPPDIHMQCYTAAGEKTVYQFYSTQPLPFSHKTEGFRVRIANCLPRPACRERDGYKGL